MRQGSPLAPCPIQVQNGIDHFADVGGSWVSTWLGGRDERFEDGPFLLGQITGVTASFHFSTSSIFPLFLLLHYITLHTASHNGPLYHHRTNTLRNSALSLLTTGLFLFI